MCIESSEYLPPEIVRETIEYSQEFGQERVTIVTDESKLRDNLVAAAVAQGINEETARQIADATEFTMGNWREFVDRTNDTSPIMKAIRRLPQFAPLALVQPDKDGSNRCHINIEEIIRQIDHDLGKIPDFSLPEGAPPEAKKVALRQAVDMIWKHERTHLIQTMQPESRHQIFKDISILQRIRKIAVGAITAGGLLTLYGLELRTQAGMVMAVVGIGSILGSVAVDSLYDRYRSRHSEYEQEAFQEMAVAEESQSPFELTFEQS